MHDLEEILAQLVHDVDGCMAAAVAGMDGLVIEQSPRESTELAAVAAELTSAIAGIRGTVSGHLAGGRLQELFVTSDRRAVYTRLLDDELFCVLVLNRHGNLGRARLATADAGARIRETVS